MPSVEIPIDKEGLCIAPVVDRVSPIVTEAVILDALIFVDDGSQGRTGRRSKARVAVSAMYLAWPLAEALAMKPPSSPV